MIGQNIIHYTITKQLGKGGMSTVYEAVHDKLETKVAIKILDPILAANDGIRERFVQEAKIMASLNHEGITRVSDFEEKDNRLAIVMEYLDGQTLDEYVKQKGALSSATAKEIMLKILDAFVYAHEKGVVHRDVKPSNIFLTKEGRVKIMDFGIAKLVEEGAKVLTSTGAQMGTPVYMSPEQVNDAKHIDHRTDIYSLGVTFWFMLAGKTPYDIEKESNFSIYNKIFNDPLPELEADARFCTLISKATAKKPEERFQDCSEFAAQIKGEKDDSNSELTMAFAEPSTKKHNKIQVAAHSAKVIYGHKNSEPILKLQNGLFGYVNESGERLIPFIYEDATEFENGRATAKKNSRWFIIGSKGEHLKALDYPYVRGFHCGRAGFLSKKGLLFKKKYGFIDYKGDPVIAPQYDHACNFSENLAVVQQKYSHGVINIYGRIIIPTIYTYILRCEDGVIIARNTYSYDGAFNASGEVIIPFIYNFLELPSEGLILAKNKKYLYGYLDKTGSEVISFEYEKADSFKNGRAKVTKKINAFKSETYYIDKSGKRIS